MASKSVKVALITGAGTGIGRATAEAFAARGDSVVLAGRRTEPLEALASEIIARGGAATFVKTDVSVARDAEQMVAHTLATFGRLDNAVNCAGIEGRMLTVADSPEQEWERVIDINLKGTFYCMKYDSRAMLDAQRGGAIVNIGSVNSFLGFARGSAYSASKHGLIGLTTSASAELASLGIRVNLRCPGVIETPMQRRLRGSLGDAQYDTVLQQRVH